MPQPYNAQLIEELATTFPRRIEPNYAWGNAMGGYLLIPRLRALWSTVQNETFYVYDHSGQGRTLTPSVMAAGAHALGVTSFMEFTRANSECLYRASEAGLNFTPFLTAFCWVRFHQPSTGNQCRMINKWDNEGQLSYILYKDAGFGDNLTFLISSGGTSATAHGAGTSSSAKGYSYVEDKWYFVAGRFYTSAETSIAVGRADTGWWEIIKNRAGVPASIFSGTDRLTIAGNLFGSANVDGYMSLYGLTAYYLDDTYLWNMFQQTRPLFMW